MHFATTQAEIDAIQGDHATKALGEAARFQYDFGAHWEPWNTSSREWKPSATTVCSTLPRSTVTTSSRMVGTSIRPFCVPLLAINGRPLASATAISAARLASCCTGL